jgi:hypothetical protein
MFILGKGSDTQKEIVHGVTAVFFPNMQLGDNGKDSEAT